jgi:aspartyl-tRNA(Asn)/glutamyl-tRNA(Gln) amidotransferase subunit A
MLVGYRSPFDATVVTRLAQAGCVTLGKLNCDEFAMGSANENSAVPVGFDAPGAQPLGHQPHPRRLLGRQRRGRGRAPGARRDRHRHRRLDPPAGLVLRHHRHQAHLRPRSRYGMIAFASSLDQAGPMARSAEDCALLLSAMCGPDPDRDSTSLDLPAETSARQAE